MSDENATLHLLVIGINYQDQSVFKNASKFGLSFTTDSYFHKFYPLQAAKINPPSASAD
jgi:hypothetical protein